MPFDRRGQISHRSSTKVRFKHWQRFKHRLSKARAFQALEWFKHWQFKHEPCFKQSRFKRS